MDIFSFIDKVKFEYIGYKKLCKESLCLLNFQNNKQQQQYNNHNNNNNKNSNNNNNYHHNDQKIQTLKLFNASSFFSTVHEQNTILLNYDEPQNKFSLSISKIFAQLILITEKKVSIQNMYQTYILDFLFIFQYSKKEQYIIIQLIQCKIYLFQTIILLIIDLAQACPYKKKNQNLLSQENFYQTIQVQRNNSEEFANFYFGFYFWIEDDHFLTPKVNYEFQNPFLYEEEVKGNLILTIEVENEIKFVVYQDEGKIIINDLEKMTLDDYDGLPNIWTLFLFVINPIEGILIFQRTEWEYQIYQLSLNLKITKIALGGLQNINGINLDVYHGRLTKLETLEYFLFDQSSYSHLLASCFLPEKFVLDFGVYKFPENNCSVSQYMCGECYQGKCLSCDKDLEEYQYFAQWNYCLCSPESKARLFFLNDIQLAACFSEMKYRTDITLIEEEITLSSSNCMFGYFDVQKNDNNFCLQCPFQTSKSVGCVECLLNQKIWYKEPICKSDFIAINEDLNSTYKFYDRKQIEYDAYIIDDLNQLVHLFGISQFCSNNQQENCFQLKKKHLNQIVFVQCKANLIQTEDACSVYDINCLEYSKNECQLCNIGSYLFNGKCLKCSTNCLTCLFNEETQSTFCTTCIENFAIFNNACQKCGQFCMQCASEYDKQNNEFFLRCQRCVSDSKFFLAFDGINCLLNQISNCLYAFQALKDNISISTLDYQFQRQLNITNIVTLCSRCSDYHIFIFSEKQCLNLENKNCIFGFADTFEYGNQQETIQPNIKCVISNQSVSKCSQIQNCDVCLYRESFSQYFCLKCAQGYYFNTFSNQCYFYHQSCILSLRQNKYTKDSWKHMVQPFYHEFIEVPYNHSYTRYAQSLDENDYEAVCQTWMLPVDQICTKISSCSKCDNQDKQICVDCMTDNYKAWTLENQQCIMCTTQCTVCKSRLIENMLKLNPYYDIIEQIEFNQRMAQICLRPSKQIDYYDWEINQFIQCNKYKSGCKKTLIVKRVLGCDFQMVSNRFTDDLYDLYDLIENERVKKIVLVYQSIKSQTCDLYDMIIGQIFSQRLFFILQAELEINCLHKIIWNVEGKIQFDKFTKISINGLIVRTMQNAIQSQFVFQSLNNQQIQFSNVIFDNQAEGKVDFQLCFSNATIISFINSTFSSFNLVQGRSFIKILPVNSNKTISLIQTNFFDFQLVDAEILNINNNKNDKIVLKNLLINGFFFNSSIIFSESFKRQGEIYIENITIQQSLIQNSKRFFALFSFTYLYINNFTIFKVNFTNTSFLWLAEQNFIQNINISNCHLDFKVCIIKNTADYQIQNTNFRNIVFAQNIYSIFSKFLKISKYDSISSEFSLKELYLKDNTLNELNLDINLKEPTHSLIFIESDIVSCNDIFIERTFGLNEFTFYNTYSLNLSSVQIVQGAFYQNKGLHQNLECFLQTCKTRLNGISILIYSAQYVSIHELILQNVYGVDYPIIHYLSESDAVQLKKETLILSSINFFGGILIQTKLTVMSAFILIESDQMLEIIVNNSIFRQNIFQAYPKYYTDNVALLFYINAEKSFVNFLFVKIESNIVINSQASILYIFSTQVNIVNCSFFQNNMFIYEFLRPHLYWPFSSEQTVYLEHLQQLFKIQSLSGNGQFRVEKVNIANSSFSVGEGNKASSFYLFMLNNAIIIIENLEFYKTHFDLFEGTQKGSVIYIDCTNSFNISVEIRNISIRSIYSSEKGGFLYLDQVKGSIEVNLDEVQLIDVFSIQGSIIYFSGLNTKQKIKIISLTNIYFISSQEGYTNFTIWYNYYTQHQKNLLNQQINLIQISGNRSLIYICQASILRIKNLQIQNLFFEKVIELQNVNKIQFTELFIYKSFFSDTCILIAPIEASPAQIVIENIKIMEVLFGCFVFDNPILEMIYPKTVRNNCLNNENLQAPSLMKSFFTNVTTFYRQRNQSILTSCQANNIFQGLINFQQFSQIHQLKFDSFQITNVNCLSCQNGLLSFNFTKQTSQLKKQLINNLVIVNSLCGFRGCLKISVSQLEKQANSTKYKQDIQNVEIDISNYICQYNQAENGTCLYLEQVRIILSSCDFRYNIARSVGGAIYSKKSSIQVQLILQSTQISENVASIGGGIFMEEQLEMNFLKFDSIVNDNKAELFANDILAIPAQLLIQINGIQEEIFELFSIVQNKTFSLFMQKLKKEISIHGFLTNYTLLPNGISIAEYKYFDWRKRIYTQFNQTFRILALTQTGVQMKNLKNSFCLIQSRTLDNTSDVSIKSYTNNFTNIQRVYFDEETQDYNLDNLVIYNRDDTKIQQTVELQFWCNSIHVPVYNVSFPYNLISQHDQYYLRIQINTYPCQIGEIRNETFQYCQICNWKEGFFQLKLNQIKCQIRDEISTSEIQPALLKVRTGFWRPYFDTSQIAHCKNSPQNCQGGWMEGDTSCFYGYIGALCEQCDIHNVRGQGEYSKYLKNTCKTCENSFKSYFSSTLSLLWTFFLTSVSAYGSIQSNKDKLGVLKLKMMGFKVFFNQNFKVIFVKILINYLQVISLVQNFEINFPTFINPSIYFTMFFNQGLNTQFDCLLSKISNLEIHYIRMIWFLLFPLIYINLFFLLFGLIASFRKHTFNLGVISTTLLNVYGYFYPGLTQQLIQLLSYRSISGYKWIFSNVAYRFDKQTHLFWMLYFCLPLVTIIAIGIPMLLARILYKHKGNLDSQNVRANFGYLYNEYQKKSYFWEIQKIFQKEFISFAIIYFEGNIVSKFAVIFLALLIYEDISLRIKPYSEYRLNVLDSISTQICLLSFALSVGIYSSDKDQITYVSEVYKIIFLLSNIHFLIYLLLLITKEYLFSYMKQFYQTLDKIAITSIKHFPNQICLIKLRKYLDLQQKKEKRLQNYFIKLKSHLRKEAKKSILNKSELIKNIQEK